MKFDSKLWMLAVALATVGCQDDLVEGGGTSVDIDGNHSTAKVNVSISTEMVTRATPGEDGDGADKAEVGSETEYTVKDVTLILYSKAEGATDWNIGTGSKLVAAGWTDEIGVMENSGATTGDNKFPNGKMTTVEVAVKDGTTSLVGSTATTYGVIAITNLGETAGKALAGQIAAENGYSTVADLDKQLFSNQTDIEGTKYHVMSTHAITGSEGDSQVTFDPNSDAIPSTSVYVERLSAKIRLSEYNDNSFTYSITSTMIDNGSETPSEEKDEIVLTNVAVVNQLSSNSFLLKRVSEDVTNGTTELPTDNDANDVIIGDEKGSSTTAATNYVIDPWTRAKKVPYPSDMPQYSTTSPVTSLKYENQFTAGTFGGHSWSWTPIDVTKLDEQNDLFLCYTQENTTGIAASVNGYSTGAVFKATYYPAQRMALVNNGDEKGAVKAEDVKYGTGSSKTAVDFFTYMHQGKELIFVNYDAILGYIIAQSGVKDAQDEPITYYNFTKDDGGSLSTDFGTNIAKLRNYKDDDPFGYISDMINEYDKKQADTENTYTPNYKAIDEYLKEFTPAAGDATTAFNKRVKPYKQGVCYYPYWIKHAANSKDQGTGSIGVMEFGIVRNNIYDMEVSGISGLGMSEVDVTDPNNPDEDGSLKIKVNLYVKNWVLRSNSGITL